VTVTADAQIEGITGIADAHAEAGIISVAKTKKTGSLLPIPEQLAWSPFETIGRVIEGVTQ
jgi:hypothetical protein